MGFSLVRSFDVDGRFREMKTLCEDCRGSSRRTSPQCLFLPAPLADGRDGSPEEEGTCRENVAIIEVVTFVARSYWGVYDRPKKNGLDGPLKNET